MSTSTSSSGTRQGQPRPARTISLCVRPTDGASGVVRISVGCAAQDYFLTEIPADFGRGFLVEKVGHEESYHVHLDADRRTCECQGYLRHSHCKHSDGLAALVAAGRL